MTTTQSIPVRVYIEDTDAGGIVYYVNYLKFMERARTEFMRGFDYRHYALGDAGFQFVVQSCQVRYHRPGRVDDLLTVSAELVKLGKASLVFSQRVERDTELLCEAEVRVGCIANESHKPAAMPADLYQRVKKETGL
ncbi:MAG: tol-pal system-associated acyl-CoA thioesterase [Alcanivoracaceae bacterium]|jgi:tol-pal system-associated acyl-CoA thioesterase|nr:tol-pal system-associated acyl-CoA thioesterase [Alcanivoracaceae bacterium]